MKLNKKGFADIADPMFYGVVAVIWLVVLIIMWKFNTFQGDYTSTKVMFSIFSLPVIGGIAYLMGRNG